MRLMNLLLFVILTTTSAVSQTNPTTAQAAPATSQASALPIEAPGISVSEINWRKAIYIPALYEDPMQANQDQADLLREQKIIRKANAERVAGGQSPLPMPSREIRSTQRGIPEGRSVNFVYEAKLKNAGEKKITTIVWEYLVFDPETEVQVGRHQFIDLSKIRPGKTANLVGYATTPATSIVQAEKAGKEHKYIERVVITRIEYEDGSFWQRPLN